MEKNDYPILFDETELRLAKQLKDAAKNKSLNEQAEALKGLGDIYLQNNEFVKAIGLYNAARVRVLANSEMQLSLIKLIKRAENSFLKSVMKVAFIENLPWRVDEENKKVLDENREAIKGKINQFTQQIENTSDITQKNEQVFSLQQNIVHSIKAFIKQLVGQCIKVLGESPCDYAVIGLGSLGLEEATLHSDFEWAILIDPKASKLDKDYFRDFATFLHIKILNLGETIIPTLAIPSLNTDVSSFFTEQFYDDITPRGFAIDGQMPQACKTPLGRPAYKDKLPFELIKTPEQLAHYFIEETYGKSWLEHDPQLIIALYNVTFIDGEEKLLEQYRTQVNAVINSNKETSQRFRENLLKLMSVVADELGLRIGTDTENGKIHQPKFDLYRLPSITFTLLALYYQLKSTNTLKRCQELLDKEKHHLDTAHQEIIINLQKNIAYIYLLRLNTYLELNRQDEKAIIAQGKNSQISTFYNIQNEAELYTAYQYLLTLFDAIKIFYKSHNNMRLTHHFFKIYSTAYHSQKLTNEVLIHEKLYQYDIAIDKLKQAIDSSPIGSFNLDCIVFLGKIYNELGQYQ